MLYAAEKIEVSPGDLPEDPGRGREVIMDAPPPMDPAMVDDVSGQRDIGSFVRGQRACVDLMGVTEFPL